MTSAQGKDWSHYQPPLIPADLAGLDFAFVKATDGLSDVDDHFAENWPVLRQSGIFAGAYHEQRAGDPAGQAAHFLATVQAAGLVPGVMLAVSVSDYSVTDAEAKTFLDAVAEATGGRNPVICYTDLSVGQTLHSCAAYDLWSAWPSDTPPNSVEPWQTWRLWQWHMTGQDADAFNGTPAEMAAWIGSYAKPTPSPPLTYVEVDVRLAELRQGDRGQSVQNFQGLLVSHGYGYLIAPDPGSSVMDKSGVDGLFGPKTQAAVKAFQSAKGLPATGVVGKADWEAALAG